MASMFETCQHGNQAPRELLRALPEGQARTGDTSVPLAHMKPGSKRVCDGRRQETAVIRLTLLRPQARRSAEPSFGVQIGRTEKLSSRAFWSRRGHPPANARPAGGRAPRFSEESFCSPKGRQYAARGAALSMWSTPSENPLPAYAMHPAIGSASRSSRASRDLLVHGSRGILILALDGERLAVGLSDTQKTSMQRFLPMIDLPTLTSL